jgi:hypothetical protein
VLDTVWGPRNEGTATSVHNETGTLYVNLVFTVNCPVPSFLQDSDEQFGRQL